MAISTLKKSGSISSSDEFIYKAPTKHDVTAGWSKFFDGLKNNHKLFHLTVVFKPEDGNNSQSRWESEYHSTVLNKFRRTIESSKKYQQNAIPFDHFYYFEKNEASIHRISGSRKPFHVHGILPIRNEQIYRVWDEENQTPKERLLKDVLSIKTVENIHMKPIIDGSTVVWIRYITKFKQI